MDTQVCFKCGTEKPLSDFYAHPQTDSGHLGKCKNCTKLDTKAYRSTNAGRLTEHRRNQKPDRRKYISANSKAWRAANPAGYKAHSIVHEAIRTKKLSKPTKCTKCNNNGVLHAHHNDYSKPLEVAWLCAQCHGKHNPASHNV